MKNIYFILLIVTTFVGYSQEGKSSKKDSYGFRMGFNFTDLKIHSDPISEEDGIYATGTFYAGFYGNFLLHKELSLQPELSLTFSDDIIFVEVPVYLNYNLNNKFIVFLGPKISYLADENYNKSFFATRSAFNFDLGARYWITNKLFIDGIFSLALTSQKKIYLETFETTSYSRNEKRLGLGYKF